MKNMEYLLIMEDIVLPTIVTNKYDYEGGWVFMALKTAKSTLE